VTDSTLKELVRTIWALQPVFEIGILFFLIRRKLFVSYVSFALYIILDLMLAYTLAPEPAKEKVSTIPNTLQRWDLALSQLLRVPSRSQ
jgi:hypothetical protein